MIKSSEWVMWKKSLRGTLTLMGPVVDRVVVCVGPVECGVPSWSIYNELGDGKFVGPFKVISNWS